MKTGNPAGQVVTWWQARNPRERNLLTVAALCLTVFVLVLSIGWVLGEQKRLRRALPLAEARLAQLQAQAEEIARLRAQAVPEPLVGVPLLEVLRASATARDLTLNIQMSEGGVAVSGQGGFDALWVWLAEIQRDHALRVVKLEMDRGGIVATLVQTTAR